MTHSIFTAAVKEMKKFTKYTARLIHAATSNFYFNDSINIFKFFNFMSCYCSEAG